ncbi:MAG: helix-turn-helix transcriptional regulator [Eubacterium sp.]|nr:helix-turn-helix transcriptional regulator [Eubacterium sp.]
MTLQQFLTNNHISMYQLSKKSGVPKSTVMDLCSGKSDIEKCNAKTVQLLAKTLNITMEELMELATFTDPVTGLPRDLSYLEKGLPLFLQESLDKMKDTLLRLERGEEYLQWDCDYCDLQSSINVAEVEQLITSTQANYLRNKYL